MAVTIDYEELDGSPTEGAADDGSKAQMRIKCAWADRWALMAEWLTYPLIPYPHRPPPNEGSPEYRPLARTVACVPMGGHDADPVQSSLSLYEHAVLTIDFSTPRGEPEEDGGTLYSESLEPTAEFITLDHEKFRWAANDGDKLKEDEAPGKLHRGLDYVVTKYKQTSIPAAALTLIGNVNNGNVVSTLLGITFAASTLLFNPPTLTRTTTADGTLGWDVTYRFTYRPDTWNKFWRVKTQAWTDIYIAGGAQYLNYPLGNFGAI